jgi:hypothetical protein
MASIRISNLYPVGSDLFKDSENFMDELVDNELSSINGGIWSPTPNSPKCHPIIMHSPYCKPELTITNFNHSLPPKL